MRTLYLKDLTLMGCTAWNEAVFPNLIGYIERDEIRPLVAKTFPLARIADAQREFLKKNHVGKFVLLPPLSPDRNEIRREKRVTHSRHDRSPLRRRTGRHTHRARARTGGHKLDFVHAGRAKLERPKSDDFSV